MDQSKTFNDLLPVGKARLHDHISQQLNKLIAEGKLAPGDRLPPERDLAERFKVSRTTVRDALRTLEARGLIETRQGDGTYVREVKSAKLYTNLVDVLVTGKENLREMLQARRVIEPGIAFYAAQNATDDDIAQLQQIVERHEAKAQHDDPGVEEDARFHAAIARMTGNALLIQVMTFINSSIAASREMLLRYDQSATRRGHRAVLSALHARDAQAAQAAMARHIDEVMAAYDLLA